MSQVIKKFLIRGLFASALLFTGYQLVFAFSVGLDRGNAKPVYIVDENGTQIDNFNPLDTTGSGGGGGGNVNIIQIAGNPTDSNTGNASDGTLRVVIASDQPAIDVNLTPEQVNTVTDARTVVATPGTAVAVGGAGAYIRCVIQAESSNTGVVVLGGSTVVANEATRRGAALLPFMSQEIHGVSDLSDYFIDSEVAGEGVTYFCEAN